MKHLIKNLTVCLSMASMFACLAACSNSQDNVDAFDTEKRLQFTLEIHLQVLEMVSLQRLVCLVKRHLMKV